MIDELKSLHNTRISESSVVSTGTIVYG